MQFLKPGEKSGIHHGYWEELSFVCRGLRRDCQLDMKWGSVSSVSNRRGAPNPSLSWKRGDTSTSNRHKQPPHVAGDHEDCRLSVMSNPGIVKEMGFGLSSTRSRRARLRRGDEEQAGR